MREEKKVQVITFRTDLETKQMLENIADKYDWSLSKLMDKLCKQLKKQQKKGFFSDMTNEKAIERFYEEMMDTINGAEEQNFQHKEFIDVLKSEMEKTREKLLKEINE